MAFEIPEVGFASVKIGAATNDIDLYSVLNLLVVCDAEVREAYPGASPGKIAHERLNRVVDLLESLGFGRVSHHAADKFETAIFDATDALKKTPSPGQTPA